MLCRCVFVWLFVFLVIAQLCCVNLCLLLYDCVACCWPVNVVSVCHMCYVFAFILGYVVFVLCIDLFLLLLRVRACR